MWDNLVRMDYEGVSILNASESLRDSLISQQSGLLAAEIEILKPDVCLFFSGPYYDDFINAAFPGCEFSSCGALPERELARVTATASVLPVASFRTYHPNFLRRGNRWSYIETVRTLLQDLLEP